MLKASTIGEASLELVASYNRGSCPNNPHHHCVMTSRIASPTIADALPQTPCQSQISIKSMTTLAVCQTLQQLLCDHRSSHFAQGNKRKGRVTVLALTGYDDILSGHCKCNMEYSSLEMIDYALPCLVDRISTAITLTQQGTLICKYSNYLYKT